MRTSATTAIIDAAMAAIQAAIEPITKNKTVEVNGAGGGWSSGFATLPLLYGAVSPLLARHGIAIYQGSRFVEGGGGWALVTRLTLGGEFIETDYPIKQSREGAHGFGGGNSFARRWAICGLFGLVPQDAEEGTGYKDARAASKPAGRSKAPVGIAGAVESIRASEPSTFLSIAARARADHPTGEASVAVERAIERWMVDALDRATAETIVDIRAIGSTVKARSNEVRAALERAIKKNEPAKNGGAQ